MKLIDNWRVAYKKFSVQALAAIGALQAMAAAAPRGVMELHVPALTGVTYADCLSWATFAVAVIGAIGALIYQPTLHEDAP